MVRALEGGEVMHETTDAVRETTEQFMKLLMKEEAKVVELRNFIAWVAGQHSGIAPDSIDSEELCKMAQASVRSKRNRVAELEISEKKLREYCVDYQKRVAELEGEVVKLKRRNEELYVNLQVAEDVGVAEGFFDEEERLTEKTKVE